MKKYLLFMILAHTLFSCMVQKEESEGISSDINELRKYIHLKHEPLQVTFIVRKKGVANSRAIGPSDYDLICELKYNDEQITLIKKEVGNEEAFNSMIYLEKDFVENWFSESIKNSFVYEDGFLKVFPKAYKSKLFQQMSYTDGFFFITDSNEIFLSISTK